MCKKMFKKTMLLGMILLISGIASANDDWRDVDRWSSITGIYQGSHLAYGSTTSLLPVGKRMTHFIIQMGPSSYDRGCRVEDSKVMATTNVRDTKRVAKQNSPSKPGWKNYVYEVNGGDESAVVRQVNTTFSGTRRTQCYYNFLFVNLEDDDWEDDDEDDDWEN